MSKISPIVNEIENSILTVLDNQRQVARIINNIERQYQSLSSTEIKRVFESLLIELAKAPDDEIIIALPLVMSHITLPEIKTILMNAAINNEDIAVRNLISILQNKHSMVIKEALTELVEENEEAAVRELLVGGIEDDIVTDTLVGAANAGKEEVVSELVREINDISIVRAAIMQVGNENAAELIQDSINIHLSGDSPGY